MYIPRKLEDKIKKYLRKPEIIAVIGPRQSGKTTLLSRVQASLKNSIFITFEDREELELFQEDIKGFAVKYQNYDYLFIDEFQYAKDGGKNLKFLFDQIKKPKIFISGSSAIDISVQALKYLVGRILIFPLYQLDFEEFLRFRDADLYNLYKLRRSKIDFSNWRFYPINIIPSVNKQLYQLLWEFITYGGYPRVVIAKNVEEKVYILKNIYNTYFLREVKEILGLLDDYKLSKLLRSLAIQIGQLVTYKELSQTSEYNYGDLKKFLNLLEKTFIIQSLKPFFTNKKVELVKNPKIYFLDTGLRNYIVSDFNIFEKRSDQGFLYENFIFTQLIKMEIECNFWRSKSGGEVDFILNRGNRLLPIESKSGFGGKKLHKPLFSFIEKYKSQAAIILQSNGEYGVKNAIYRLPHWAV